MIMKKMTLSLTIIKESIADCWKMKKSSGTGSQGAISCNFPLEEIFV